MPGISIKAGEIVCLASGIFSSYTREGPFVATRNFDIVAFVDAARALVTDPVERNILMESIPELLLEQGLIEKISCREIHLGALGEFEVSDETDR